MCTKKSGQFLGLALMSLLTVNGCSKPADKANQASTASAYALPSSWYVLPEKGGSDPGSRAESPSPAADSAVRASFQAHTAALESVSSLSASPSLLQLSTSHPLDWTPWHLDGMIASFALSLDGIFGSLLFDGTASIRAIWQQASQPAKTAAVPLKAKSVRFSANMSLTEIAGKIEPVVQAALAAGKVTNEKALRKNLLARAQNFLSVCAALESVPKAASWTVDSFQLQLTVSASGQVSPAIGVGGALNIFFDWQKASGDLEAGSRALSTGKIPDFVQTFQSVLASLPPEALAIEKSGFVFDKFQLGLAVNASGDIGLAQLAASVTGKMVFVRNTNFIQELALAEIPAFGKAISLVSAETSAEHRALARRYAIPMEVTADGNTLFKMDPSRFRQGLQEALRMASYFAQHAREADTKNWKVNLIESEFDSSLTGDLKVATLSGTGTVVLDFDRVAP